LSRASITLGQTRDATRRRRPQTASEGPERMLIDQAPCGLTQAYINAARHPLIIPITPKRAAAPVPTPQPGLSGRPAVRSLMGDREADSGEPRRRQEMRRVPAQPPESVSGSGFPIPLLPFQAQLHGADPVVLRAVAITPALWLSP